MKTALVVLAAGLASRYGGNKQVDGIGPHGEILMEYSIHDAIAAGFNRVVFIIKPGMEELIRRLKQAGYGIYLLSNTGQRYYEFRKNIPALRWFDGEFISADWKLLKPEPEIYRAFCQYFHLVPAQCLFVDDLAQNVYGAQRAGMKGVVFYGDPGDLERRLREYGVQPAPCEKKEEKG